MVETIGPMVRGAERSGRRIEAAHIAGGTLGGLLTGVVAGSLGTAAGALADGPPATLVLVLVTLAATAALLRDLLGSGTSIGFHRQTPRSWRYLLPPGWTALLNGADLGLGWTTRIYFASFLATIGAAFLSASPLVGGLIGALFGASRAATAVALTHTANASSATMEELIHRRPLVKAVNGAVLGAFVVLMAMHMFEGGGGRPWL